MAKHTEGKINVGKNPCYILGSEGEIIADAEVSISLSGETQIANAGLNVLEIPKE